MAKCLCCLERTVKVLCSNLRATRYRMILDKLLTAVCLGSPGRCILITCDIHRSLWLVSVYDELKWLSGEFLGQVGLLSGASASNSCRKKIGLSKLSPNSTLYHNVAERRGILLLKTSVACNLLCKKSCNLPLSEQLYIQKKMKSTLVGLSYEDRNLSSLFFLYWESSFLMMNQSS
jgi:hypothetical protein